MSDLISRQAAIDAAVEAADEWDGGYSRSREEIITLKLRMLPSAQPESCEDTVSRQRLLNDLKELITAWKKYPVMAKQIKGVEAAIEYVKAIPSADRPKGEWVFDTQIPISGGGSSAGYRCSICGRDYFHVDGMNFCPNCGSYNGGWQSD